MYIIWGFLLGNFNVVLTGTAPLTYDEVICIPIQSLRKLM